MADEETTEKIFLCGTQKKYFKSENLTENVSFCVESIQMCLRKRSRIQLRFVCVYY